MTPVLFTPWRCDQVELNRKVSYARNDLLHRPHFPPHIATLGHCMVIDLPLEGIDHFVSEHLHWLPLKPDAILL